MDAKQSLALYEEIFKGAQMGIDSIDEIMRRTKDRQFRHELMRTQNTLPARQMRTFRDWAERRRSFPL